MFINLTIDEASERISALDLPSDQKSSIIEIVQIYGYIGSLYYFTTVAWDPNDPEDNTIEHRLLLENL